MTTNNQTFALAENESAKKIVIAILGLRKTIVYLGVFLFLGTVVAFINSAHIFSILQTHLHQPLAYFSITGPFLAHVKLALISTIFFLMPIFIFTFWRTLAIPFKLEKTAQFWFIIFTAFLFYAGSSFCYFITLPFGIDFLLGFESEQLQSIISVSKFVNFVTIFILAFGLIFELPILMVFAGKTNLISRKLFEENRRYALLAISIIAALLTPTPDVVNMLLMGGPLYCLYEAGILILRILRIK